MADVSNMDDLQMDGTTNDNGNTEVEPAPTECVMIKEEPDLDLEYDPCERNTFEEDDEEEEMQSKQSTIYQPPYLPEVNRDVLKRKLNDALTTGFPTINKIHIKLPKSAPDVNPTPTPKKRPARTTQKTTLVPPSQNKANNQKNEEEELRMKYLMNASETEERMRNLQVELNKAKLEREKTELKNLKEMHQLQLENLKLEKELLTMKLKSVTEQGVSAV